MLFYLVGFLHEKYLNIPFKFHSSKWVTITVLDLKNYHKDSLISDLDSHQNKKCDDEQTN